MHYRRFMTTGNPFGTKTASKSLSLEARLYYHGWDEVVRVPDLGVCWEWRGGKRGGGYGRVTHKAQTHVVTRVAYELWVGPIPDGHVMMHECDNPPCMNPSHLKPGTVAQNAQDMVARDRANPPRGAKNGKAKLSGADIPEIRRRWAAREGLSAIAADYGVTIGLISMIGKRVRWAHISD